MLMIQIVDYIEDAFNHAYIKDIIKVDFQLFNFQSYRENDFFALLLSISEMFFAFVVEFIICELGQQVTNAYETIEITFKTSDWYLYPIEL